VKKRSPCCGNTVKVAVGVRHQLVALLASRIEAYRMVNVVVNGKGHLAVEPYTLELLA
jgi:hypothetical protein